MSVLTPTRDDTLCRPCDDGLWKPGAHRDHGCGAQGACLCPVCNDHPLIEVRALLDALDDVVSLVA